MGRQITAWLGRGPDPGRPLLESRERRPLREVYDDDDHYGSGRRPENHDVEEDDDQEDEDLEGDDGDGDGDDTADAIIQKAVEVLRDDRMDPKQKLQKVAALLNAHDHIRDLGSDGLESLMRRQPMQARRLLEALAGKGELPRNGSEFAARLRLARR